jgi:hypothetical protein
MKGSFASRYETAAEDWSNTSDITAGQCETLGTLYPSPPRQHLRKTGIALLGDVKPRKVNRQNFTAIAWVHSPRSGRLCARSGRHTNTRPSATLRSGDVRAAHLDCKRCVGTFRL